MTPAAMAPSSSRAITGATRHGSADAPAFARGPMNWSGLYVGGHLGGAWSTAAWADPFGATLSPTAPRTFRISATSPRRMARSAAAKLAPIGNSARGSTASKAMPAIRRCAATTPVSRDGRHQLRHVVNAVATLAGRAGFAWDRSLFYLKGGGAWTNTTYNLDGNTFALTLGQASSHIDTLGWVAGIGLEYAITDHWTTRFEYDHIDLPTVTPSFPTMPPINTQRMGISQSVETLELGVNYKLDWLGCISRATSRSIGLPMLNPCVAHLRREA